MKKHAIITCQNGLIVCACGRFLFTIRKFEVGGCFECNGCGNLYHMDAVLDLLKKKGR